MSNEEQIAYWNGEAGRKWAERDRQMATILAPVSEALMDHASVERARAVLDVGCGGGSNSFMLAERLHSSAQLLGVDVSAPMLEVARAEGAARGLNNVRFLQADAAEHDFGSQQFDLLFSRFGVMFFEDPGAAFTHMRGAMTPGADLAFVCWQPLKVNPWTALPLKAALTVLPPPEAPAPRSPGPFAFGERDYVDQILRTAGWTDIDINASEVAMRWPAETDYPTTVREVLNTGPVGRLLVSADAPTREAVYDAAAGLLENHFDGDALVLPGAVWLVTARNPS